MKKILELAYNYMNEYVKTFYSDDKDEMLGIATKEEHTGYVTKNCRDLAEHLHLNEHDVQLAELIGLLHDIGRFRQWQVYHTFVDGDSEDHANLGLKVIVDLPFYKLLAAKDQELLLFAIGNHNKKEIVKTKSAKKLLFAKIIRDADKLDIYRVLEPYLDATKEFGLKLKFSPATHEDRFAAGFLEKFVNGEQVDYRLIETQNDRKLVRLMWVYDVNFSWTLQRIRDRGFICKIISSLPDNEMVKQGVERLNTYVDIKCATNDLPVNLGE
ncbi:MAG: HD domain-containing protein [Phascolarctobacterium sp.]|nr:HD domain-containing protein [Phascolarctobacterium sp.]